MKVFKNNIYYVGAMNPNLRVFDIIMRTEFGTSYNAYLIKGPEKTVLIDTVHEKYFSFYLETLKEIMPIEEIDYLVMNHTEPDHSGSVKPIVELIPNIQVFGSAAAMKNIKKIINRDFNGNVVKTGDSLDLGGGEKLEFFAVPNVHWPDTIFTYYPAKKTLFTCDFLGCHYCEPTITDDFLSYEKYYWKAFREYYDAIMSPFKKFVNNALDTMDKLDVDLVCNSHGPVLIHRIDEAKAKYREWSATPDYGRSAAILYVSAYGYTRKIAEILQDELEKQGVSVKSFDIIEHELPELMEAMHGSRAILFGSPTINRDALRPVWDLMASVDAVSNKGKPALIFGSYGWSGEAAKMLMERAAGLGLKVYPEPIRIVFRPSDEEIENIRATAREFAKEI